MALQKRTLSCGHIIEHDFEAGSSRQETMSEYMLKLKEHIEGCREATRLLLLTRMSAVHVEEVLEKLFPEEVPDGT